MKPKRIARLVSIALLLLTLSACTPAWEVSLIDAGGATRVITRSTLRDMETFADANGHIPLEQVLYENSYRVIETLNIVTSEGQARNFDWPDIAETALWGLDGSLRLGEEVVSLAQVTAVEPSLPVTPTTELTDIAPTVSAILGLPAPAAATGRPLSWQEGAMPRRVLLIFLDGFGYVRYTEALEADLIPNLAQLGAPRLGLSVYPPSTSVASAAMLTGAPPGVNGVATRGIRTTDAETLFDVVAAAELRGVAVERNALAFNLRNAETMLSGDRDGDGSTDDNVLANALEVLNQDMPDLLWVHFHGIDDAGHTYGPDSPEERAKIVEVDAAVGSLLSALPPDTATLIFADHGMHAVSDANRLGNHGQLIARDMLVPMWFFIR